MKKTICQFALFVSSAAAVQIQKILFVSKILVHLPVIKLHENILSCDQIVMIFKERFFVVFNAFFSTDVSSKTIAFSWQMFHYRVILPIPTLLWKFFSYYLIIVLE